MHALIGHPTSNHTWKLHMDNNYYIDMQCIASRGDQRGQMCSKVETTTQKDQRTSMELHDKDHGSHGEHNIATENKKKDHQTKGPMPTEGPQTKTCDIQEGDQPDCSCCTSNGGIISNDNNA